MLALVATLLAQVPAAPCDYDGGYEGARCQFGGFRSRAGLYFGSGAPDLVVGEGDNLPDGGWGPGSKYGLIRTMESSSYDGWHADLTVSSYHPRSAGLLLGVENSFWSPGFIVWAVDFAGNTYQHGRLYVYGNGNGVQNLSSYAAVRGQSAAGKVVGDVMLAPNYEHHDKTWIVDVWNGPYETPFRVRDDARVWLGGQVLGFDDVGEGLAIRKELPDGGQRTAFIPWQ